MVLHRTRTDAHELTDSCAVQLHTFTLIAAFSLADFIGGRKTSPFITLTPLITSQAMCAWYVDTTRRYRWPWFIGIVVVTMGTFLFGFAKNMPMLYGCQILHGFSSAVLYTVGLAMLCDTIPKNSIGYWMGIMMTCSNLGMVMSPVIGGAMFYSLGKWAVFGAMMIAGSIDFALRLLMKEPFRRKNSITTSASSRTNTPTDTPAAVELQTVGATVSTAPTRDDSSGLSSNEFKAKTFQLQSNGTAPPGIVTSTRLSGFGTLLKSKRLLAALWGVFAGEFVFASLCATVPIYMEDKFGWDSLGAGLTAFCYIVAAVCAPAFGWLSDRFGPRWFAVCGSIAAAPVLMCLWFVDHNSMGQKVLLCGLITLSSMALVSSMTSLSAEFAKVAEELSEKTGCPLQASSFSLMNCAVALAGGLGPVLGGFLKDHGGWNWMAILLGLLSLFSALPCVSLSRFLLLTIPN
jgi:MFS family permease